MSIRGQPSPSRLREVSPNGARYGEHVLLGRYRDFIRGETGQRQRYPVPVVGQAFDIAGWVVGVAAGVLGRVDQLEQAVKADSLTATGE